MRSSRITCILSLLLSVAIQLWVLPPSRRRRWFGWRRNPPHRPDGFGEAEQRDRQRGDGVHDEERGIEPPQRERAPWAAARHVVDDGKAEQHVGEKQRSGKTGRNEPRQPGEKRGARRHG